MGIFSRFTDIIHANIHALLDKAENPDKMIRLMIQEMEESLVTLRSHLSAVMAEKKQLIRKKQGLQEQQQQWQEKAELALSKEKEMLARAALLEQRKKQMVHVEVTEQLATIEALIEQQQQAMQTLEKKLIETRIRQRRLQMQEESAKRTLAAYDAANDIKLQQAWQRFEQMEQAIDQMDAQQTLQKTVTAEQQLAELQLDEEIEQQLNALKIKMQQKANQ